MECPYCKKSMEKGAIFSFRDIRWVSDNEPNTGLKGLIFGKDTEITLSQEFFKAPSVETYLCKQCKKMIINLGNRYI